MIFNTLFFITILSAETLAFSSTAQGSIRRHHKLISKRASLWSTISNIGSSMDLALDSFKPKAMLSRAKPAFDKAPDGSDALRIHFAKGAYDYKGPPGGISFYATPMDLSDAKEIEYSYSLYFDKDFDCNKGGKLPGMYGGDDSDTSISCSGGRRDTHCWSARFMFREDCAAELYTYLPQPNAGSQFSGNKQLCDVPPESDCNDVYGASVARGSWDWKRGGWTHVTQRIKLNDGGEQNGEIQVTANNKTVINLKGLALGGGKNRFQGIQMQSFFGGHEPDWASPKEQDIYTKDYKIEIMQKF